MKGTTNGYILALLSIIMVCLLAVPASASGNPGAGCEADTKFNGTIQGSVYLERQGGLQNSPMTQTFENVPSNISIARIYTGVWGGSPGKGGFFNITIQNATNGSHTTGTYKACDPESGRCDVLNASINNGTNYNLDRVNMHDYVTGCGAHFISFNATPYITPGTNTITVKTAKGAGCTEGDWDSRIYLIALLVVYENSSMPYTTYWINEGALYLSSGSGCSDDAFYASTYFNGTNVSNPAKVKLWSLGWPNVIEAETKLNNCNIGSADIKECGGYNCLLKWNNVSAALNNASNLLEYNDSTPAYERAHVEVLIAEGPGNADLTVTDIGFPTVMRNDTDYTITANVENQGGNSTGAFNVSLYVDDLLNSTNQTVSSLAAGESKVVNFTNVSLGKKCYDFKVVADSNNTVTEAVENNNERTEKYQVGNVIVVKSNSDFADVNKSLATNESGTYYIQNLNITNCAGSGIHIENTSVPFVIRNCTVHNCSDHGIYIENAKNGTINESDVYGNDLKGIRMVNSSYMLVDNNSVYDNEESYGIDVYMKTMPYLDSHNITISNNTIERNLYGIELFGLNCTIRDNNVLNNTAYGIYVMANDSKIYNNNITNSSDYGVKLYNSARNYVYCNNFTNNNAGNPGLQAWDDGAANDNHWNTTDANKNYTGNYWKDWQNNSGYPCNYTIDGGSNVDKRPKGLYDFLTGAGGDKWAFGYQVNAKPPDTCDVPRTIFTTSPDEYVDIKTDDGEYKIANSDSDGDYAAHRFNFSISENVSKIKRINVTWNGIGWHDKTPPTSNNGSYLYIWKNGTGYEELANNAAVGADATLTGERTTSISSYINSGNVTILVVQKTAETKQGDKSHIETDYVKVVVAP